MTVEWAREWAVGTCGGTHHVRGAGEGWPVLGLTLAVEQGHRHLPQLFLAQRSTGPSQPANHLHNQTEQLPVTLSHLYTRPEPTSCWQASSGDRPMYC